MIVLQDIESVTLGALKKGQLIEVEDQSVKRELIKLGYIGEEITTPKTPKGDTEIKGTDKSIS